MVGTSDSKTAIYNESGLDISQIVSLKSEKKSFTEYQSGKHISNNELLELSCDILTKNIPVIPDILANAGGVTVSYFEQVQNNTNYFWSREEVQTKLKLKMETALV